MGEGSRWRGAKQCWRLLCSNLKLPESSDLFYFTSENQRSDEIPHRTLREGSPQPFQTMGNPGTPLIGLTSNSTITPTEHMRQKTTYRTGSLNHRKPPRRTPKIRKRVSPALSDISSPDTSS